MRLTNAQIRTGKNVVKPCRICELIGTLVYHICFTTHLVIKMRKKKLMNSLLSDEAAVHSERKFYMYLPGSGDKLYSSPLYTQKLVNM